MTVIPGGPPEDGPARFDPADYARATLNILDDYAAEEQQLKHVQSAIINILEDATAERLNAEAAFRATLNILSDLSDADTLNTELESRVQQRTAELQRVNQSLQAFAYSVSHDLRGPLRALSGFSEALMEEFGDRLGETGCDYAARIQAASERMSLLIDALLRLSRLSRADMGLVPVNLSAEAASIVAELRSAEPGRVISVSIQDGVWARADPALIHAVIRNLLENAWKFTARQADASIEFTGEPTDGGQVRCRVRDNGVGFDPAYAGKLFRPFERLHSEADFPGTGIGLASVRRIVERHGGQAWAESGIGQGASFYFTLPAAQPPPTTADDYSPAAGHQ